MSLAGQSSEKSSTRRNRKTAKRHLPHSGTAWGAQAYALALEQLGFVSVTDVKGRITYVNDEFLRATQYSHDELIGQDHRILNSGHHPAAFFAEMYRTLNAGDPWRAPMKNRAKDDSFYWVDALIVPLRAVNGRIAGYLSVRIDITRAVNLHCELGDRTALLQSVLDNFPGGVCVFDENLQMTVCNDRQREMLELPDQLFAGGAPKLEALFRFNAERGEFGHGDVEEIVAAQMAQAQVKIPQVFERRRPNGTFLEIRTAPLADGGFVSTFLDITERKHHQAMIAQLAHHDSLTGLPNRLLFQDRIEIGLGRVERGESLALLYLDLDRFKSVNDTLGHPVGDELLKAVAGRLKSNTRAMDTVARLGGDEFAIVLTGTKSLANIEAIARRIIAAISAPYEIGKHAITIGASVGIALAPNDGNTADQLLKNADLALYRAKKKGRGTFSFFEQKMHDRMQTKRIIETGLRSALSNGDLHLHYQPIINIADRTMVSCEALIRWSHATRGLISAAEFIPVAEESGLIGQIGEWVLSKACDDAKAWPEHVSVSVNVSPAQFRGQNLEATVLRCLNGLCPSRLVLEITESLLLQNSEATAHTLQRLRSMGIRFALDDFGTGFSSLSYLQSFPFDKIKIDRSFVSAASNKERAATLRRAIAQLGHNLGMTTVAEGVETAEQLAQVQMEGCVEAQGFLFSKAVAPHELRSFFHDGF